MRTRPGRRAPPRHLRVIGPEGLQVHRRQGRQGVRLLRRFRFLRRLRRSGGRRRFREEHPSVYIADDAGLHRYDIFAVYAADVKDRVYQELDVEDEETRQAFIRFCLDSALADTGVTPEAGDRILTLSTCTGDGYAQRWVVQAVLRPEAEEGPEEGGGAG